VFHRGGPGSSVLRCSFEGVEGEETTVEASESVCSGIRLDWMGLTRDGSRMSREKTDIPLPRSVRCVECLLIVDVCAQIRPTLSGSTPSHHCTDHKGQRPRVTLVRS
jgi:hypothetical protein